MIYYLIYDSEDTNYTIYYKHSPDSEFLFNQAIENRWGPIEHAFSKLECIPAKLKRTKPKHINLPSNFSIVLEFTFESNPELFI